MTTLDIGTGLFTNGEFLRLLSEEVERARADDRHYAVIAIAPQRLPGEGMGDIIEVAAGILRNLMRDNDLGGRLDGEALAIGLPDTDPTGARVFAHRLQGDLALRSYHLRNTVWEPGIANLWEDGDSSEALLETALENSRTRRRRLGN